MRQPEEPTLDAFPFGGESPSAACSTTAPDSKPQPVRRRHLRQPEEPTLDAFPSGGESPQRRLFYGGA